MFPRTTRPLSLRTGALATAALTLTAVAAGSLAATSASAAPATDVTLYPSDALTVPDAGQLTGRRIALPTAGCGGVTTCGLVDRLNELDGFDLDPRIALDFDAPVDVAKVLASASVRGRGDTLGLDRVVYDPTTYTVYAHPSRQLRPKTTYTLVVSGAKGLPARSTTFTTQSSAHGMYALEYEVASGRGLTEAGVADADRGLQIDAVVPVAGTTFRYQADTGSGGLVESSVPVLSQGTVVFGSYLAPSWLRADGTMEATPSAARAPVAVSAQRLPFVLTVPAGHAPAGGWPTSVFGHGFTRSDADVLVASLTNSSRGVATISTDVVGHGYGPLSTWTYERDGVVKRIPAHARGIDVNGDGAIGSFEGSSTDVNSPAAAVSNRDALRQTDADISTMARAVQRGLATSPTSGNVLRSTDITYFGQSFGGIYGTMLAAVDPLFTRSALNVAGGPITEIARLSPSFRPLITQSLSIAGLLNSTDPSKDYFEESLPLQGQPPVLAPAPGAVAIQAYLADTTWLDRAGTPETFARLIPKEKALFQVAFGDMTVPNPTAATLLQAGSLFDRTALYRNDRTANAAKNPHGFLLDLLNFGGATLQAQNQIYTFLQTGAIVDPDGAGNIWELSPPKSLLRSLNF